jgi:integrase/recombinase XerC
VSTWDEAVSQFLAYLNLQAEASPVTYDHYRRNLARFAVWWERNRKDQILDVAAIQTSDIRDWRDHLRVEVLEPGTPRERLRKAGSVNTYVAAIKSLLTWAEDSGVLAKAPETPKRVKTQKLVYKALPRTDHNRFVRAVEGKRNKRDLAIVLVFLDGGLRVAELCALLWRDISLSDRKVDLLVWHGKGDKQRTVPLSNRARKALLTLRGDGKGASEPVFQSRKSHKGGSMTPRAAAHAGQVRQAFGPVGQSPRAKTHLRQGHARSRQSGHRRTADSRPWLRRNHSWLLHVEPRGLAACRRART